jgi:hypothetical protein
MCIFVEFHHRKNGLSAFFAVLHKIDRHGVHFFVECFHPLLGERAGVLNATVGITMDHAARTKLLFELWVLRIVWVLRLFLCVEVIEVPEELTSKP